MDGWMKDMKALQALLEGRLLEGKGHAAKIEKQCNKLETELSTSNRIREEQRIHVEVLESQLKRTETEYEEWQNEAGTSSLSRSIRLR